jgi:hypothetical protein
VPWHPRASRLEQWLPNPRDVWRWPLSMDLYLN